jgi:hypothetical protein
MWHPVQFASFPVHYQVPAMPATSSRYQSRLFTVIAEQSQRWSDRVAVALRQVKVATVWGLQAIVYPVYALFKVSGLLGTQAPPNTAALPNEPIAVDTPIHRLVEEVKTWEFSPEQVAAATPEPLPQTPFNLFQVFKNWFSPKPTPPSSPGVPVLPAPMAQPIRGITNLIPERTLALVSDRNQVLDILTPPQQAQLEQRIIEEVGNYWQAQSLPQIQPAAAPTELPNWGKTKPIANAFDLLKNVTLSPKSPPSVSPTPEVSVPLNSSPVNSEVAALPGVELPTLQTWKASLFTQVQTYARSLAEELDADLATLHQDVVDNVMETIPTVQTSQTDAIADPWFAAREANASAIAASPTSLETLVKFKALPAAKTFGKTVQTSTKKLIRESLSLLPGLEIPSSEEAQIVRQLKAEIQTTAAEWKQNVETQIVAVGEAIEQVVPLRKAISTELEQPVKTSQTEDEPEWIETQVTTVEYVKHPLEKMLEWLDLFMFWIEEQVVRLWNWVKQLKVIN